MGCQVRLRKARGRDAAEVTADAGAGCQSGRRIRAAAVAPVSELTSVTARHGGVSGEQPVAHPYRDDVHGNGTGPRGQG